MLEGVVLKTPILGLAFPGRAVAVILLKYLACFQIYSEVGCAKVNGYVASVGLRMSLRKRVAKSAGVQTPLLDEIEAGVEAAVRKLLAKGDMSVADLLKIREVVREILAERPRSIRVRWVDSWEGTKNISKKKDGTTGTLIEP